MYNNLLDFSSFFHTYLQSIGMSADDFAMLNVAERGKIEETARSLHEQEIMEFEQQMMG